MGRHFFTFSPHHLHPKTERVMWRYYVEIIAETAEQAREEMIARGYKWIMQYHESRFDKITALYGRFELIDLTQPLFIMTMEYLQSLSPAELNELYRLGFICRSSNTVCLDEGLGTANRFITPEGELISVAFRWIGQDFSTIKPVDAAW